MTAAKLSLNDGRRVHGAPRPSLARSTSKFWSLPPFRCALPCAHFSLPHYFGAWNMKRPQHRDCLPLCISLGCKWCAWCRRKSIPWNLWLWVLPLDARRSLPWRSSRPNMAMLSAFHSPSSSSLTAEQTHILSLDCITIMCLLITLAICLPDVL